MASPKLLLIIFLHFILARPRSATGFSVTQNFGNRIDKFRDISRVGLRLYAPDQDQPTCVSHGFIVDKELSRKGASKAGSAEKFEDWLKLAVEQHNRQRVEIGYLPVQLSQSLSQTSATYLELLAIPNISTNTDLLLHPEFYTTDSMDIQYEDTYYNEKLRFQAPDSYDNSMRACCPAPFMRYLSNETRQIGISRKVYNVMGNFNRLLFVAVFHPKSNLWTPTGLCTTDEETLAKAMHDSSEYIDQEEYVADMEQRIDTAAQGVEANIKKATLGLT